MSPPHPTHTSLKLLNIALMTHSPSPPPCTLSIYTAWRGSCTDELIGYSPWFGVQGQSKPMRVQNQTFDWQMHGPITKVNMYYSWNFGCLQGKVGGRGEGVLSEYE